MAELHEYEGWKVVFTTDKDYEAEIVRDRLDDAGMEAVKLSKKDTPFNTSFGDAGHIYVLVQPENEENATSLLASSEISEDDLTDMALNADDGEGE